MSIVFNADEVFETAAQIERNGAAFYRKAAGTYSHNGETPDWTCSSGRMYQR